MAVLPSKNKISALAKDLRVKSKDILALFPLKAGQKPAPTTLNDVEVDFVLDTFSKNSKVEDINQYINGKVPLAPYDIPTPRPAAPKKESAHASLEQPAPTPTPTPAPASMEPPAAAPVLEKAEEHTPPVRKSPEQAPAQQPRVSSLRPNLNKPNENTQTLQQQQMRQRPNRNAPAAGARPAAAVPVRPEPPARPARPARAESAAKAAAPKKQVQQRQQGTRIAINTRMDSAPAAVKKDVRVVDTRGSSHVDLAKYDERIYEIAGDTHDSETNMQKLKKTTQRQPFDRRRMERMRAEARRKAAQTEKPKPPATVSLPEEMIVSELARELRVTTAEIVKKLMYLGMVANVNQTIDFETAAIVADEFGSRAERQVVVTIEDKLFDETEDDQENLVERSPVVVVMGHVDHGKTSLLDAIRHARVTDAEAGGITQHIGAYRVDAGGKELTFLDTPGHEAFTAMRARGAQATDIAILVVAADDGIMPQTVEAINHAKAADVSIIVAINKMDKPNANPDNIMQELTKYELIPEEWGGDVICVPVSALTKQGIDTLLESILLVAEMAELKANPNREAKGIVIEAKLDKGRGPVATVLVQNGTLRAGDYIIAGTAVGRVRAMLNDKGEKLTEAGPSVPVEVLGLTEVPGAGDIFNAVKDERMAKTLAAQRRDTQKENTFNANAKVSLDDLFNQLKEGAKELNIIVKADVQGSAEAVKASLEKLSGEEVKVRVIHAGVGGINESDVMLAAASNALIVGFNVRPDKGAIDSAERQQVDIRTYRVIYECIEEITAAMKGMLDPKFKETVIGHAEVRQTIRVPNVGVIAGCYILDGKVLRNANIRVVRDGVVVFEDKIGSLKRFKDDVKEVAQGYECGIGLEKFNDIKEQDILEASVMEEIKQ